MRTRFRLRRLAALAPLICLTAALALMAAPSFPSEWDGYWSGTIEDSQSPLRVDLDLRSLGGRAPTGSIDARELGFLAMDLRHLELTGDRIAFECDAGRFEGTLTGNRIEGKWSHGDRSAPFELDHDPARRLFSVRTEEVEFLSGGVTLAGTLHLPDKEGGSPAAVLIHGSGAADRSSLAKYAILLARNGIAALTYDKRGVGASGGDEEFSRRFDLGTLADDALAGARLLAAHPAVAPDQIGLIGVSQGGWVAPLAASRSAGIAWLVGISASVTTVAEDRLFERAARLREEGFTDDEIASATEMQIVDQEVTRTGTGFERFAILWDRHRASRWFRRVYLDEEPTAADDDWRRWYRTQLDFDPVPLLEQLEIPALWLYGEADLDRHAPVEQSIERLEQLRRAGKPYRVESYPDADHNLSVEAGWPGRIWAYGSLSTLVSWVTENAGD